VSTGTVATEKLTVDAAKAELEQLQARANVLRKFLRANTPQNLTRLEVAVAEAYVDSGDTRLVARQLGMSRADVSRRLANACRKLGVTADDRAALGAALAGLGGVV
jgi:DNA-binding NarL/FixJ family response regulator